MLEVKVGDGKMKCMFFKHKEDIASPNIEIQL
jgi:hypothetical protein